MEKRLLIGIILLMGFVLSVSAASMYAQSHILQGTACGCQFPIELLIPLLSSGGLLVGSLVYYFMSSHVKSGKDLKLLLGLVDFDERTILLELIKAGGSMPQSRLVDATGFNKVKVSRLVAELGNKEVVKKTTSGVTNLVELEEKLKRVLCE